jgi:hypothetical protein
MAKIKLDSKQIKEYVTKRYELVALGVGAVLAVICLLLGVSQFFAASSPDQEIAKTAKTLEQGRFASPPTEEDKHDKKAMLVSKWPAIGPKEARVDLSRPFFYPNEAGEARRFMPKILAMVNDPQAFQMDYIRRGVYAYDASDTQKRLMVFGQQGDAAQGVVDPVFLVMDQRLVVVSGLFPYFAQSEEYKKALRFDDLKEMFAQGLAPTFEGLLVERRKITKSANGKEKVGEWEVVYGVDPKTGKTEPNPALKRLLETCIYDATQVEKYMEVIYGASVTPLPVVAGKFDYPEIKIPEIAKALTAGPAPTPVGPQPGQGLLKKGKSIPGGDMTPGMKGPGGDMGGMQGGSQQAAGRPRQSFFPSNSTEKRNTQPMEYSALPKDLQDQLSGDVNWCSPYGTFPEDPNKADDGGDPKKDAADPGNKGVAGGKGKILGMQGPGNIGPGMFDQGQGSNLKAPMYPPTNPMALVRFVDADVAPGAEYQYRIAVRLANPNYKLSTKQVANAGWTKIKEYASDWVETPRISIPEEYHFYVINQTKGWVSRIQSKTDPNKNTTNDGTSPTQAFAAERVPFQLHKFVGNFKDSRDELTRYVADWEVAERVLVGKGEVLGREVEIELITWNSNKGQFEYAGTSSVKGSKTPKTQAITGVPVDFRPAQPIVLLDYSGGEVKYMPKSGARIEDRDSAIEALLLMPDGTMIVRSSRHDMDDRGFDKKESDLGGHHLGIERRQRYEEWKSRQEEFRQNGQKAPPTTLPGGKSAPGGGIN